jgi:F-type H+-transporting ATPase subunit delta
VLDPVVARRYAEALFLAAEEASAVPDVDEDLRTLASALADRGRVAFLFDPTLKSREKRRLLEPLVPDLKSQLVRNVVALAIDRRREEVLPMLSRAFHQLALEARGEAEGVVESAAPLPADALREVEEALGRTIARRLRLEPRMNPALVGGLRATIGSRRYDASVLSRLSDLRARMLSAPLPTSPSVTPNP